MIAFSRGEHRAGLEGRQAAGPAVESPPAQACLEGDAVLVRDGGLACVPGLARRLTPPGTLPVEGWDLVRDVEVLVLGQAEETLGEAHLLHAESLAVGLLGVGAVWRRPADVAAKRQQGRTLGLGHATAKAGLEGVEIVRHLAETLDVPAVGLEALEDVVMCRRGRSGRRW